MTNTKQNLSLNQAQSYSNLTTEELQKLINEAQAGSQAALDQLCEQFRPLVESISHSFTCHSALGEDATNTAWLFFLELIAKIKKPIRDTFPGLLKRYLNHRLIDKLEVTTRLDQFYYAEEEDIEERPCLESFEEQLITNLQLQQLLRNLKPEQQKLIHAHYFENKTLTNIAAELEQKVGAIKMQHHRIIKELKKQTLYS